MDEDGLEFVSPPLRDLYLRSDDFSQFDGASLASWHLSQLVEAPISSKSTVLRKNAQANANNYFQTTFADDGLSLLGATFVEETPENGDDDVKEDDRPFRLKLTPQSAVYLSYKKYRVVVCLDASPSSLSIDPISGTLFLDVSFQSVEHLLHALVQSPAMGSAVETPEIHISILVQGALADSLCVLAQGYTVNAANVHSLLKLLRERLHLLEDSWANAASTASTSVPTPFSPSHTPASLAMTLQNGTFALNSLPHDAAPLLFLVTDGVVDLPQVYDYDHMMMQLARHHITCHAIQLGGGFVPHCSFGYVPDTDLLRYVTAATGGSLFDMLTLQRIEPAQNGPFTNNIQAACFLQPSKVCPANPSPEMPLVTDRVSMDTIMQYRPLRLFREKVHEFTFFGSATKLAAARLEEGFCVAKVLIKDVVRLHCLMQWTSDVWLEYSITAADMRNEGDLKIRIDLMAHVKFLEEFILAKTATAPNDSVCHVLHRFLKVMYERDRTFLHLVSAMQTPTLDQDPKVLSFYRSPTITSAHPVFTLVGRLSPLLWHRWFHVERFEMIAITQQNPMHGAIHALYEQLNKWANMMLEKDNYLKFLSAEATSKSNVDRKQRGSLTNTTQSPQATPAKKALCFVRVQQSEDSLIVVYVAFYGTTASQRKNVMKDLQNTLSIGVNKIDAEPNMVVCHRHVERLFLQSNVILNLIEPPQINEEHSANAPLVASCCGGTGLTSIIYSAYMWRTLWCWHVDVAQQEETMDRLQEVRTNAGGFCLIQSQADKKFTLLAKEIWLDTDHSAVMQYAITVVSETCLCTSLWMEPTSGRVIESVKASGAFGTPIAPTLADQMSMSDGVESSLWYQRMQKEIYLADVHILSSLSTFHSILDATKSEKSYIGPLPSSKIVARVGTFPIQESPFSTARLLTTARRSSDRFLLYIEPMEANTSLHDMLVESVKRLSDCEVAWTDEMGTDTQSSYDMFTSIDGGPLWCLPQKFQPLASPMVPGRCFAKSLSDSTFVLVFIPQPSTLTIPDELPEVEAQATPSERLKWLAGMSSSVVNSTQHQMTPSDLAQFTARRSFFDAKVSTSSYLALPIDFYECSIAAPVDDTLASGPTVLDGFKKSLKDAHEHNFAYGVHKALRHHTLQACDLLQALWICQQIPIDLEVTLLYHMLHLLPTAPVAIDPAFDELLSQVLTPIPQTQWYFFTSPEDTLVEAVPVFVRLECWQHDSINNFTEAGNRPRSKSVRVLSNTRQFTDVLRSMLCQASCDINEPDVSIDDKVLECMETLRSSDHPKTYLRLVVMALSQPGKKEDEHALPPTHQQVFQTLRLRLQELCAVQVLSMLRRFSTLTPSLGAMVQLLFQELPETSLRRVQYSLDFLPVEGPTKALMLFTEQLITSGVLPLQLCNDVYFVCDASDELPYWAYFSVDETSVWLHLHLPPQYDHVALLTRLHLGILTVAKLVNQFILLQQLHESRSCSSLLVPPPRSAAPCSFDATTTAFFWPGQFECECKFKKLFKLHERLAAQVTLNGICNAALEQFQVHNRLNMFVYKDKRGHVFYMQLSVAPNNQIELQVFGICEPAEEVTVELCRVLERKIDEAIQLIIMKALARNSKFQLGHGDVVFICPDITQCTYIVQYALPSEVGDPLTFLYFLREKMTEATYARTLLAPTSLQTPLDVTKVHPAYVPTISKSHHAETLSPVCFTNDNMVDLEKHPMAFVFNINPEFVRSAFISSCGKGVAIIHLDVMKGSMPLRYIAKGRRAKRGTVWSKVLEGTPTLNFPQSELTVRFRVYVRGHLNGVHLSEAFALSFKQALYEYAIESILETPAASSSASTYPTALLTEYSALLTSASALTTSTAVVMHYPQAIPSYEIPHVVKQVSQLFQCLPPSYWPTVFHRSSPNKSYQVYENEKSSNDHNFTESFIFVCPFTASPSYALDEAPAPPPPPPSVMVKVSSSSSLLSVETSTSLPSPMVSPRHTIGKEFNEADAMLHPVLQTNSRRYLFYSLKLTHQGVTMTSYNLHAPVLETLSLGIAKILSWCQLRQALLSSILFQKRGLTLAAPTKQLMLQPAMLFERKAPLVGKTPLLTSRELVHITIPFTPQIFSVVLEHNVAPRSLSSSTYRAIEGMGLAEYLRETGTYIEDLSVRPRAISGNTEKLDSNTASTPMSTASSSSASSIAPTNRPVPAPSPSPIVRKTQNSTDALMAARARARGPMKGAAIPQTPTSQNEDNKNKPPPAWTLTLSKDIPPRVSKSKPSPVTVPTPTIATRRSSGPLPQHPEVKPAVTPSKAEKDPSLKWRQTLKTLLPSSFSHYHRDDRDNQGSTKAKDPLTFHGMNLRSALDFHESYRSSYTMVYDVFKSLMASQTAIPELSISPFTLEKLLGCGRLIVHRQVAVTFSGCFTGKRRHIPPSTKIVSLLAYEIRFIFNDLFASIAQMHMDDISCCLGGPPTSRYGAFQAYTRHSMLTLQKNNAKAFCKLIEGRLVEAGFAILHTEGLDTVFVRKAIGVDGLVLIELKQTKQHHIGLCALFVSERDVVSLDAGRHLPQTSYPQLTRHDLVPTIESITSLMSFRQFIYDFAISDMHRFILHTLSLSIPELENHIKYQNPAESQVRNCVEGMTAFLEAYPVAPAEAKFGLQGWEFLVDNVDTLIRYIACHATRYFVSDLLMFGTPDAIATRSATGRFIQDFNQPLEVEAPYTLVLTSASRNVLKVYAIHATEPLPHLWEQVELFVMELMRVASVDYKRDVLWSRLLFGFSSAEKMLNPEPDEVDIQQLEECLALSVRTPVDRIDPTLTDLLAVTNVNWSDFVAMLKNVHKDGMREYQFHNRRHVLLMCQSARDIMIHIYYEEQGQLSMEMCRREEPPNGALSHEQRKTLRDFVNLVVYWLWTQVVM
ncbi:hypothetical protein THRCLA_06434 [Thraustotheca clavata]|uniref:Uncharacterized protein n=1 Tax=Thraustotheca clavata TaxID=74557 RepID=A0A1V9ZNS4_9STRA|nr:hypothetical protein THRCLA_06434 [Thraustotheca clavata]